MRILIFIGLLALLAAPAVGQQATAVGVDKVITEPLVQTAPVIGRLVATRSGVVAARIAGPIAEMRVRVGDRIASNAIIAVLDDDRLRWQYKLNLARVGEAKAALETAKSIVNMRVQESNRMSRLKTSAAFSQARLADKKLEVASAESATAQSRAALITARANLQLAKINLDNAQIRAPFAGVVSQRYLDVGSYVNVGSPVIGLIDDGHLEIEAQVPARHIGALRPGISVGFRLEQAQQTFSASVRAVLPREDPLTRTRLVRLVPAFGTKPAGLATNQTVVLALPVGKSDAVTTVHKDAVLNRKGKNIVFVVADGKANLTPVRLGQALGSRFVVLSGLDIGDIVVVRGNERLRPGQKVRAK